MTDTILITPEEIESAKKKHNVISFSEFQIDIEKVQVLNFDDLRKIIPQPIQYVLNPILPVQGLGFVYAATGVGKTFFMLNLAYAIAGGGRFLKYISPLPRRVLYIDGEMAFNQIHGRIMQIAKQQGELDFPENLCLITPDKILPLTIPQIDEEHGQTAYNKIIEKYNIEVIVFDNLSMLSSVDENKSNEWKRIQSWFLQLRSQGKTVLIVHHSGKETKGYRGTSKMLDCADFAISLQTLEQEENEESILSLKKFKIVYQKARTFGGIDAASYEANFQNGIWGYQSIEISILDRVVECHNVGMKQREIAKELFISQTSVNRLIAKARGMGRLKT